MTSLDCLEPSVSLDKSEGGVCANVDKTESLSLDDPVEKTFDVVFLSSSNQELSRHTLTLKDAHHCKMFSSSLEQDSDAKEIPIQESKNLTQYSFERCIEYLKHHKDDTIEIPEKPLQTSDMTTIWKDSFDPKLAERIYVDSVKCNLLYETIMAANYFNIEPLMNLIATKFATIIQDCKACDVANLMGIEE